MRLDKAIEILELYEHAASSIPRGDFLVALHLGIEALKEVLKARSGDPALDGELLPWETET